MAFAGDESDPGNGKGQSAKFTVDAYPAQTFSAHSLAVRNAPQTIENVVTYKAVLEVDNPERLLRPGMTATLEVAAVITMVTLGGGVTANMTQGISGLGSNLLIIQPGVDTRRGSLRTVAASLTRADAFILNLKIVAIAFAFSGLVGVVFGFFPARRAAPLVSILSMHFVTSSDMSWLAMTSHRALDPGWPAESGCALGHARWPSNLNVPRRGV